MAPHNPLGPIATAAAVHFATCTPNWLIQESFRSDVPWRDEVIQPPLQVVNGYSLPNERPGLGVEVNEKGARKYPFAQEILGQNIVDCQVDYWIALESLFGTGEPGQTRQMACRISCLLFGDQENDDVVKAFLWLEKSYQLRCKIVHGDHYSKDGGNFYFLYKIVEQTKEVVKWTVERLILLQMPYQEVLEEIYKRSRRANLPSKEEAKCILSDENMLGFILAEMDQVMDRYRGRTV